MTMANDILPNLLWYCESSVGQSKVGMRTSGCLLHGHTDMNKLNLFETDSTSFNFNAADEEKEATNETTFVG